MGRYDYTELERQINTVLLYQRNELESIRFQSTETLDIRIAESEELLLKLGYTLPGKEQLVPEPRRVMVVPKWEALCEEAEQAVGNDIELEALFSAEELAQNSEAVRQLNREYNALYRLDRYDIALGAAAGLLGAAVDILLVGIPKKTPAGLKAGTLADFIRGEFDKKFPAAEMEKLANSKISKVPYDAQDNRHTTINVDGLSTYYHRLLSLGHDPLLGFIIGVADILNGTMTTIDKSGKIVRQAVEIYTDRRESDIFAAIAKQIIHFKSDITTSMGLPAPLMGLFNLLQFGSIGAEEQTIAEIVQGMYYEGYDFIHFCSLSVPVMLVEVIVRLGYAIRRIKEGYSIRESIPFSKDREKLPKLNTILFMGHTGAAAINAGKVYFTGNPMAINYPQWLAFTKYAYSQMKWALLEKPELRDRYVSEKLYGQLGELLLDVDRTFNEFAREYIVIID